MFETLFPRRHKPAVEEVVRDEEWLEKQKELDAKLKAGMSGDDHEDISVQDGSFWEDPSVNGEAGKIHRMN